MELQTKRNILELCSRLVKEISSVDDEKEHNSMMSATSRIVEVAKKSKVEVTKHE